MLLYKKFLLMTFGTTLVLLLSSIRYQFIHGKLKEYQNKIYVGLRSVNFHATMTNIRSHVPNRLVDYLIKEHERREICR